MITSDGHIRLVGQSALQRRDEDHAPMTLDRLPRGHYAVDDATLDVLDLRSRQGRFQLTGANIDVRRKGNEITVVGRVELPGHLGSFIDFEGQANGDLADTANVAWRARVDARDLDLEQWAATLPDSFRVPVAGHGSIRVSARGAGREVTSLRVQPALVDLRLAGSTDEFTRVAGDIRVQRDATTVSLEAAGFRALARRQAVAADELRGPVDTQGWPHRGGRCARGLPADRESRGARGGLAAGCAA